MLLCQSNADKPKGINSLYPSDTFDIRPTKGILISMQSIANFMERNDVY